jgi:hypothetical protein
VAAVAVLAHIMHANSPSMAKDSFKFEPRRQPMWEAHAWQYPSN